MRIQTFVWLMALYAAVAFCGVRESARQMRIRYRLAQVMRQEDDVRAELDDWRAREMTWLRAAHLMDLNDRRDVPLEPLRTWSSIRD